jgi:hypothetical protein
MEHIARLGGGFVEKAVFGSSESGLYIDDLLLASLLVHLRAPI